MEPSASTTYVSFRDRKTAEKLYYSLHGKELPGVDGKLDLSWVNNAPASAATAPPPSSSTSTKQQQQKEDDTAMDDEGGDAMAPQDAQPEEMEYSQQQRVEDEDAY